MSPHVVFESLYNFRDLGGHRTADGSTTAAGVLFRADGLHRASPSDRRRLLSLGIRTVVDLRSDGERRAEGIFGAPTVRVHHAPLIERVWGEGERPVWAREDLDGPGLLASLYDWLLSERADVIASAVTALAESDGPAVFHCSAGKDRTGLVAALLLSTCGVATETIAADYAGSAAAMPGLQRWYRDNDPRSPVAGPTSGGVDERDAAEAARAVAHLAAEPATMLQTLEAVAARWGSARRYLVVAGVPEGHLRRLVERMVPRARAHGA